MDIKQGEIYGKRTAKKMVMYNVLKVSRKSVLLQNIDNPRSLFETTTQKLEQSGYARISQTPYVETGKANGNKRKSAARRLMRCPYTLDFLEGRADCEKPAAA
jgi:hypothetical protein